MKRLVVIAVALLLIAAWPKPKGSLGVRVASKQFTESVILGEIATLAIRAGGDVATHFAELGGTRLVYDALRRG